MELLVKAGSNINITNNFDMGPLYLAILNERYECAYYLVENQAACYLDQTAR